MIANREISHNQHSSVTLRLTINQDAVQSEYDEVIKRYGAAIQLKGFRKGKAPRDILERKLGDALKAETLASLIEKALEENFSAADFPVEAKPLAYSQPTMSEKPELQLGNSFSFTVTYDVYPEVKLGPWKGLTITTPEAAIEQADIDRELAGLRERNAIVVDKDEKAAAALGDIVTIDFVEINDGQVVEDSGQQDFVFTLGSGHNKFKFDDDIVGMKLNDSRDIIKTFDADHDDPELRGTSKSIRITLKALKEKRLPELDDELAQDISEKYANLTELIADIKSDLQSKLDKHLQELKIKAFLEQVIDSSTIDLPQSMIQLELEARWQNLARRFGGSPEQLAKFMAANGRSYEDSLAEWQPDVEKSLKSQLIIESLMKEFNIELSEADLENEFASVASSLHIGIDEVKQHYADERALDYLRDGIKQRQLFDQLLKESKLKVGAKVNYLDLVNEIR